MKHYVTVRPILTIVHEDVHIAHCDIRPTNILIDRESGKLTLINFWESEIISPNSLKKASRIKRLFKPPEAKSSEPTNLEPGDIYSAGCTLIYLATARFPNDEFENEELFRTRINDR